MAESTLLVTLLHIVSLTFLICNNKFVYIEFQSMLKSNEDEKINAINSQNENENASEAV